MQSLLAEWLSNPTVIRAISALIGVLIIILVARIARSSITRYVSGTDSRYRLRKFITFLAYILVALMISLIFSDQLGSLTVAFGVAGAGVAFALQEVIASFAGWFAIHFAQFYKTGDRVEVGGIKGDVIDISFLRTILMEMREWVDGDLYTGRVVRVANSFVFKAPVYNYSGEFPFLWDEIKIPVKYGCDHKLARKLLIGVADKVLVDYAKEAAVSWEAFSKKFLLETAITDPMVSMVANDNWIEFTLRYVVDYKKRRTTKDLLFSTILDEFSATDGAVEIASATFHLVEAPPINVKLSQGA
ncbi:MAG: mechanosensitive ion channel family protein [Acidobacteria bacterium]|nr:MAG: mechanosensitive ion channel family protein [Acidobacteriota bacterium]REK02808.1 MAG: mechanosensitive ion channel family protein [Acidobacteriota bacterium]REK13388.1 MAG: mechanosensitive ion channel family protein [Acidobacteriota bacterium]REK41382.1 MAG: mechanosensitive ion channel family protein [Acidobacteriota bacterium]